MALPLTSPIPQLYFCGVKKSYRGWLPRSGIKDEKSNKIQSSLMGDRTRDVR